jgi:hypothetical protein
MVVVLGLVMFVAQAVRWRDENAFREHFINFLRPLSQQPVPDPNDPRLKKWKDLRKPPPEDPDAPRPFWPWQR